MHRSTWIEEDYHYVDEAWPSQAPCLVALFQWVSQTALYLGEWHAVAQERKALTEEADLQVDCEGRGRELTRRQRAAIWKVLEAYAQAVVAARREEWPDVVRRACHLLETGQVMPAKRYRAVIVDEAQDMGTPEMRFLLALVGQRPDSLLLLGDTRQQIYARGYFVRLLNIPIGRRHMCLHLNYRTTEQIRSAASNVVSSANALTGEPLGADDNISLLRGPKPLVRVFATLVDEEDGLVRALRDTLASGMLPEEIIVVARTGAILTRYAKSYQPITSSLLCGNYHQPLLRAISGRALPGG